MEPMTWLEFVSSYLIAAAWLLVPGLAVVLVGRMRGFFAVALAPMVSITLVSVTAVVAQLIGVRFNGLVPAIGLVVFLLVAAAFGWWRNRRLTGSRLEFPPAPSVWWLAAATGAGLLAWNLYEAFQRPEFMAQRFDNVWHLNAIRSIVDSGDGSSLTVANLNGTQGGFYPAAFHDVAALVMQGNGGHINAASNATVLAIVTIIWPMSALFLVRSIFRPNPLVVVPVGVLAAAFPAFPLRILDFGPLHPNILGLSILPIALGIAVQLGRLGQDVWLDAPRMTILGMALLPGLVLSHPNVVMLMLLVTSIMAATVGLRVLNRPRATWGRRGVATMLGALAYVVLVVAGWPVLRPGTPLDSWPPAFDTPAAAGIAVTNATTDGAASWVLCLLMIVGWYAAVRRGLGWLVAIWGVVAYFFIVAASFPADEYRLMLVGIWYNDFHRFVANLPVVALPLAVLGLDHLVVTIQQRLGEVGALKGLARPWLAVVVGILVVAGLAQSTQHTEGMDLARKQAADAYRFDEDSSMITPSEFRLLQQAQRIVPEDAVIANYPGDGSSLTYALIGRHVLLPHFYYEETPARRTVAVNLDEAATDPTVCPILREAHVRYVLDLGGNIEHAAAMPTMRGLDQISTARGFREVARDGHSRLYEITACG